MFYVFVNEFKYVFNCKILRGRRQISLKLTLEAPVQKMVKLTQAIRRLLPTNCLSVFDHFVGLALKGLSELINLYLP